MDITVLTFESLDSTNTEALNQARAGAAEGLCVVAREQTAGRGRQGRTWISPKDSGLYFSIVLRPAIDARSLPLITLMAGIAVHDTIAGLGLDPDIKWVNDILVAEKKISGILAETAETPNGLAIVVGIGINIRTVSLSPDLTETATSIEDLLPTSVPSAEDLTRMLTRELVRLYDIIRTPDGPATIVEEWHRRSTYFSGKSVRVVTGGEIVTGVTDGLEANGALRVRRSDDTVAILQSGDVERIRPN